MMKCLANKAGHALGTAARSFLGGFFCSKGDVHDVWLLIQEKKKEF